MYDTAILGKVSRQLERLCRENKIIKLQEQAAVILSLKGDSVVNQKIYEY
ncbi:hypothetical protein ACPWSR_14880 [Alloiococcus sp. CFN-8]